MSDFLGRVGRITEWVVISNVENRAVNAACDKAQDWWKNKKNKKNHNKHHQDVPQQTAGSLPPDTKSMAAEAAAYPSYPPQQQAPSYMAPPPPPPPGPSMGPGQLAINVNYVDGLNQWGPLIVILECNHQRYHINLGQQQQQQQQQKYSFPIYQFDYDQLLVWIQTEYQSQTIAHGEIPIRILLNGNNGWTPSQQRWVPLRDQYNGPSGQVSVNIEYSAPYSTMVSASGASSVPPPPYPYYS